MRLYSYWRSSCSWRVRIALALKGVQYEYVPVHLIREGGEQNKPDYLTKNPMRTVPMLEFEEDGRLARLSQSLAIIEWLDERHPTPPLLPKSPLERAKARQLAEVVNAGIQPLQNTAVQRWVKHELHQDEKAWTVHWIERGMTALEAMVAQSAGTYCVGDQVSVADLCLVPQMYSARRFGENLDLSRFPTLLRIDEACGKLEAFQAAHPDQQPDAQPV